MSRRLVGASFVVLLAFAAPASAQPQDPIAVSATHLDYDALTFETTSGGKTQTLVVSNDGRYALTTASGKSLSGTLTPSQWFDIAASADRAPFSSENGKALGAEGKTSFRVEAKSSAGTYSVSGDTAADLGGFASVVSTLEGFETDTLRGGPGFELFPPKLPVALDVQLGSAENPTKVEVLDTGSVKITANGKTYDATLTPEEERAIAAARRRVDGGDSLGNVSGYTDPKTATPFRIVVYETLRQFLLEGSVGNYGTHDDVGALVTALRAVVDRVESAPAAPVAKPAADESGGLVSGLLDRVADSIARWLLPADATAPASAPEAAGPSRTPGLSALLDARIDGATDKARGDDASDR
jgi:hypothetical protein